MLAVEGLYSTDYIFISYWQGMFPVIRYMLSVFLGAMAYICMDGCMHCLVSSCTGVDLDLCTTCRAAPLLNVFLCSSLPGGGELAVHLSSGFRRRKRL